MELHKLLTRQIRKFLPDEALDVDHCGAFMKAISDSYTAYERDQALSNHAFAISEQEYHRVNVELKKEVEARNISIRKLKEIIHAISPDYLLPADNDLVSVAELVKDLSDRQIQLEQESNKNIKRITSLISNLNSGILFENENREILFTNQKFCDMFGIPAPPELLAGMDCSQSAEQSKALFEDPESFVQRVNELLASKRQTAGDILYLHDGRVFERDFVPVYMDEAYKGHLWNYTDITQKQQIQQALIESEAQTRLIMHSALDAIVTVDTEGLISSWNPQAERLFGWSEAEALGGSLAQLIIPEKYRESHEKDLARYWRQRESPLVNKILEMNALHRMGHSFPIELSIAPIEHKSKQFFCYFIRDISERKKAETAKEAFIANMSHEIRTPLNAIIGMLRELGREDLTPKQNSYLSHSDTAAKHLLSIVNNILDMSRIEAGEFKLDSKDFSLASVVNMVHSILYVKAKEKGLTLKSYVSPQVEPALIGDSGRIRQILINIIGNAIKFTEKGSIELDVEVQHSNPYLQKLNFTIRDTGIGMSAAFLDSIFDKFSQENAEQVKRYEGTGLGMTITKEMIHLMGGKLDIKSEKGKGTEVAFEITLPVGNPAKVVSKKEIIIDKSLEGLRCLLVEDNEMNQLIASRSLDYFGCLVTAASDGQKAIDMLAKENFDFVLMDIQMPVMDGLEATEYIRNVMRLETPIIALTANAFKSDIDRYLAIGMNDYITKPYEEYHLFSTIANTLNIKTNFADGLMMEEPGSNGTSLYDLTKVIEMGRGDRNFVDKMVQIFVDHTPGSIAEMHTALAQSDFNAIAKLAHRLKPGLANMGVHHLVNIMRELEAEAKNATPNEQQIAALIQEADTVTHRVIAQLKSR